MKKLLFMMLMMAMTLTASAQESKEDKAKDLLKSGYRLYFKGKYDEAIKLYEDALNKGDFSIEEVGQIQFSLGETYLRAHYELVDDKNKYAVNAMSSLEKSFVIRPLYPRTIFFLGRIYSDYFFCCKALVYFSLYAISCAPKGVDDNIDEIAGNWTQFNIPADMKYKSREDSIVVNKIIEIGKQPRSQYGLTYDMLTGVFRTICTDIKDEPTHPVNSYDGSVNFIPALPLYAKLIREGYFEALMHYACKTSKSGHIANGDWCSQNKELVDKTLAFIKNGQYLCDLKDYRSQKEDDPTEADKAHENIDEAKKYMQTFLSEKMNTQASVQAGNNIWQWVSSSPEVNVAIGEEETKWMNDNTTPCLIAYSCGYAMYQLEKGNKEMTADAYLAGYRTMLKYYEENKDVIGNVPTLQNYLKLMKENPAKFEETIKNNMPKEQK